MYLNVFCCWLYLYKQFRKVNATLYNSLNVHSYKILMYIKSYIIFIIHPSLMMVLGWAVSTWKITNYGKFIY